jgi:16S rRNA (cytidine1402-2'-O)-methyltransferase
MRKALGDMLEILGERRVSVGRELTKMHEEIFRGPISGALARFTNPRGEFTIVIGAADAADEASTDTIEAARRALAEMRTQRIKARDAVRRVTTETGLSRRKVYAMWLEAGQEQEST